MLIARKAKEKIIKIISIVIKSFTSLIILILEWQWIFPVFLHAFM